jgi:hypothetical protein
MRDADRDGGFGLRFAAVVAVLAMAPTLAFAYIDPGNGAYMVQALFALVGAAFFYLRHPIRSLKSLWQWTLDRVRPRVQQIVDVADTVQAGGSVVDDSEAASASLRDRR